jgi:NAD+ synthase
VVEDITPMLTAAGCYERRDAAIRTVLPEYGEGWKAKIVLPSLLGGSHYSLFSVVAESPEGERREAHLTAEAYREVVAATNFKQRVRKMLEHHHADRLDYAVVGTPNRLECDHGLLRQERRRVRGREAGRPPLQDPGPCKRRAAAYLHAPPLLVAPLD